ncbi:MAG: class I SAM-dependent methyltransferase [Candidatus Electrothrix sp. AUS1_2]|nr:class I SAM-dependent methyltransferase [Candidatus Electrothrix sp. AUS1_2]
MKRCLCCNALFQSEHWHCQSCGYSPSNSDGFLTFAPKLAVDDSHFPLDAFKKLADLEAKNFWFSSRNQLIIWAIRKQLPQMNRYLEIGCGTGFVLSDMVEAYPKVTVTGSEISSIGLIYASQRVKNAELIQMDARCIPYAEEFDAIGAFDVLEHIEEDEKVLSEMLYALRPGGIIVITVPQHTWLWSQQDEYACHVRRYNAFELLNKVNHAGFEMVTKTGFVSLLLPFMFLSRLVSNRQAGNNKDAFAELRMPGWLNRVFGAVMAVERRLIRIGGRFSCGGSLLLVAQKPEV